MPFTLSSFAKINLHLEVLGRRSDGFHEIFTIFQTISLFDEMAFEIRESGIELNCDSDSDDVPIDESNLILRAGKLLQNAFNVSRGASINLSKRIPIGGGLGGGSSNGAAALVGLSRLWDINASIERLSELAAKLGSDVPFFLIGATAIGKGRGEIIQPIDDFTLGPMIVVTPDVHVSTQHAYAALNLTNTPSNRILNVSRAADIQLADLKNEFEKTVFADFPEIQRAKNKLIDLGATFAQMSGSGASVFGIFDNEETRQTALKALGEEANWRSFAVAAVSRNEYREKLGV
jgi:4-diphosphocytidyl-2-C-methyl-D-erythritol kinase